MSSRSSVWVLWRQKLANRGSQWLASEDLVHSRGCWRGTGSGAMTLLTRAMTLFFVSAFRGHPQCRSAFQKFDLHDIVWIGTTMVGSVGISGRSFPVTQDDEHGANQLRKSCLRTFCFQRCDEAACSGGNIRGSEPGLVESRPETETGSASS